VFLCRFCVVVVVVGLVVWWRMHAAQDKQFLQYKKKAPNKTNNTKERISGSMELRARNDYFLLLISLGPVAV